MEAIEHLARGRVDEHVERLAYHAGRGERWAEAVRYAWRAGTKAFDRSANREAAASFDEALAALARLPGNPQPWPRRSTSGWLLAARCSSWPSCAGSSGCYARRRRWPARWATAGAWPGCGRT